MKINTALYLTDVAANTDSIFTTIFVFGVILFIVSIVGKIVCADKWIDQNNSFNNLWTSILKKWWILALISLPPIIIPAKHTMYLMMATTYLQESNLPAKVSKALELKLDKYIDELTHETKDKNE